ncbi:GNAT family N-acetyltransferase [Gluconacetobacter sp. 1c LMG 22058]|uniref:Aminoglycoside N(6')-acetyltransferase type 1 n=1 Tax=Gluconacetobacter dulcium TaxID=2729096 RepID=A0A7W4JWL2_9PROT|nr:aminoglycoside 6'-N-acetyltransferase [Gluconacetobacter dulcium]MBB2196054.1 GNAT family N-acetyltransferase [Gluconacetobacter dulcium]
MMEIIAVSAGHIGAYAALRVALWPAEGVAGHREEIERAMAAPDAGHVAFLAVAGRDVCGFAEAALRHDYVNGCTTSPVAFVEGLYVSPDWRLHGVARLLIDRVVTWARGLGCAEIASDADVSNTDSHAMHAALGFAETERVVFFRRSLC